MKKLYIMFALILSSFFFYSSGVKANTYDFIFNETDFDYLNDTFYKVREFAIDYANNNDCYYYINHNTVYYLITFFKPSSITEFNISSTSFGYRIYPFVDEFIYKYRYDSSSQTFISQAKISSYDNLSFKISNSELLYTSFLDSNYDFYLNNNVINFSYKDINYIIDSTNPLPTLYEIYLNKDPSDVEDDIHKEEKNVLSNFYSLIFEKIDLLANSILSNYIYLTIIVIFILIFLIELIRRYLL